MTDILIISGFLGSGKTSLIKKLIKWQGSHMPYKSKMAIIENEFGEESIDGRILKDEGIDIREINAGCICCSVRADFRDSIKYILKKYKPELIVIEPSGVGKLSDIESICRDFDECRLLDKLVTVDINNFSDYIENFAGFYLDQIQEADRILLSRIPREMTEAYFLRSGLIDKTVRELRQLNKEAEIYTGPWDDFDFSSVLDKTNSSDKSACSAKSSDGLSRSSCDQGNDHSYHLHTSCDHDHNKQDNYNHDDLHRHDDKHDHDHDHNHNHDHDHSHIGTMADEVFNSIYFRPQRTFSMKDLQRIFRKIDGDKSIRLIRSKGILAFEGDSKFIKFDYVPGELTVEAIDREESILVLIGENIKVEDFRQYFE